MILSHARAFVLFIVLTCVSANAHAQGTYRGHIVADRALLLKTAPSPEGKKLLHYVFDRFGRAKVSLTIEPGGTFKWSFDDGDEQDRTDLAGTWKKEGGRIVLSPKDEKPMTLQRKGRGLVGPFLSAKGYTVEYTRM